MVYQMPQRRRSSLVGLLVLLTLVLSACGGAPATSPGTGAEATAAPAAATEATAAAGEAATVAAGEATAAPAEATAEASAAASEAAVTIKVGTLPWIGYGPWWIAKEKGFFEKHGVNVELVNFTQDAELNAALAAGQIQAGNIATHTAIRLLNSDTPLKLVLLLDASYEADAILAGPDVASVADLKGKEIAYEEGTTSDLLLTYALSQNGLSKSDVTPVFMAAADAGAALIAKRVPVAVTYEPYITTAVGNNTDYRILYSGKDKPGLISDFLVVRDDVLSANGDAIKAMLAAWGDAVDFLNTNAQEGQAIIATNVGAKPEELTTAFAGVKIYSLSENKQLFSSGEASTIFNDVAKTFQTMQPDQVKTIPDPKAVITDAALP